MSNIEERALHGEGTTLLTPTVKQDNPFGKRAVEIYIKAMCRDNDRPQRVKLLSDALEVAPEFREAYFWRGILNFTDVQQNITDLRRALTLTPLGTCQYFVIQSQIYAMSRFPEQTVVILTNALNVAKNDGDLGEIYYFRAFANWWIDRDEDAFSDCKKAIEKCYNIKSCYTHLADMSRFMNKSHEEILQYFKCSLLPSPKYTELVKYAIYLKKRNQKLDALAVLEQAIKRNPYSPDAYEERASITHSEKDYLMALHLDTHSKLVQCRRMFAAVLADRKQNRRAIQVLTDGIKAKPRAEWYCLRGQLRIEFAASEKEQLKGCEDLRKAVQLNPCDPDLQFWLGIAISRIRGASTSPNESLQRSRNALHLAPHYQRMPVDQQNTVLRANVEEFKFFESEAEGLYQFSKHGTAYQYAITTRKVVCLLAEYAQYNERIALKVFNRYSSLLYMWLKSDKPQTQIAAERALNALWDQQIPEHVLYMMKKIPIMGPSRSSLLEFLESSQTFLKCFIESDFQNLNHLVKLFSSNEWGDDVYQVFLHYIYRKPISITKGQLLQVVEFAYRTENKTFIDFLKSHIKHKEPEANQQEKPSHKKIVTLKFQNLFKDVSRFINDEQTSDVTFHFPDENKEIRGNRMILSANCPYFSRMLNSGLRESTQSKISIDISFDLWYQIMVYCYGGKVIIDPENCVELLRIADKFGLPGLKILCELYIGKAIDEENVEAIQQIASLFNSERLMSHCELKSKKIKIPDPMLVADTVERVEKV